jgi:hypothetical protein
VFKRLLWLSVGAALGLGSSWWAMAKVRRAVERLAPERVTQEVVTAARSLGAQVRDALDEGRAGMREREAQLRADMERGPAGRV